MRITIFGGTGPTGQLLVQQALDAGHDVVAYVRTPGKLAARERLHIVKGELSDRDVIAQAITGSAAVLSLLGPGLDAVQAGPLVQGTTNIIEAMEHHGVRRLVVVATPSATDPSDGKDWRLRFFVNIIKLTGRHQYETIRSIAAAVRRSTLDWTIVRVPFLTNGSEHEAKVRQVGAPGSLRLSRKAVAAFFLAQATDASSFGRALFIANA